MIRKVIKCMVLILIGLSLATSSSAQRFGAGLVVGFNAAQIDGDDYAGYSKIGLVAGIQGTAVLTDKIDLGIELRYSQIGSRSSFNDQNSNDPFNITLNYAEIPVIVSYKDWYIEEDDFYRLEFHAGLTYARLINSKLQDKIGFPFEPDIDLFNDNYLGANIGVTYFFNEHLGATFRFNRAILWLYDKTNSMTNRRTTLLSKHLTFTGIYRF